MPQSYWGNVESINDIDYVCGFCDCHSAPTEGYYYCDRNSGKSQFILICPSCSKPTFLDNREIQYPPVNYGEIVQGIKDNGIASLYEEARTCTSNAAYTASVIICRKILMNLGVSHGAEENQSFQFYVNYLSDKGFIPPQGKMWVDKIRDLGNDANHQIQLMSEKQAKLILKFTEALLRFNFEIPSLLEEHSSPNITIKSNNSRIGPTNPKKH